MNKLFELLAKYDAGELSTEAFIAAAREVVSAAKAGELTAEERAEAERFNNQLLAKRRAYQSRTSIDENEAL